MTWLTLLIYVLALALSVYCGAINFTLLIMPLCGSKSASFRAAGVRLSIVLFLALLFFWFFVGANTFIYFKPYQALVDALYLEEEPWAGVAVAIPVCLLLLVAVIFCFPIPVDILLCLSMSFLEMTLTHRFRGTLFSMGMVLLFAVTSVSSSLLLYFLLDWFLYSYKAQTCFEVTMSSYTLVMGISQALVAFTGFSRRDNESLLLTIVYGWLMGIFAHVFLRRRSKRDAFDKYPQVASEFAQRNLTNTVSQRESRGISPNVTGEPVSASPRLSDTRPRRIVEAEEAGTNLIVLRTEELFVRPLLFLVYSNAFFNLCEIPLTLVYLFFRLPLDYKPSLPKIYSLCSIIMIIGCGALGYRQSSALSSKWIKITPSQAFIVQISVIANFAIASFFKLPCSFCLNLLASMVVTTLSDTLRGWRPTDKRAVLRNVAMICLLLVSSMFSTVCLILIRKIPSISG